MNIERLTHYMDNIIATIFGCLFEPVDHEDQTLYNANKPEELITEPPPIINQSRQRLEIQEKLQKLNDSIRLDQVKAGDDNIAITHLDKECISITDENNNEQANLQNIDKITPVCVLNENKKESSSLNKSTHLDNQNLQNISEISQHNIIESEKQEEDISKDIVGKPEENNECLNRYDIEQDIAIEIENDHDYDEKVQLKENNLDTTQQFSSKSYIGRKRAQWQAEKNATNEIITDSDNNDHIHVINAGLYTISSDSAESEDKLDSPMIYNEEYKDTGYNEPEISDINAETSNNGSEKDLFAALNEEVSNIKNQQIKKEIDDIFKPYETNNSSNKAFKPEDVNSDDFSDYHNYSNDDSDYYIYSQFNKNKSYKCSDSEISYSESENKNLSSKYEKKIKLSYDLNDDTDVYKKKNRELLHKFIKDLGK